MRKHPFLLCGSVGWCLEVFWTGVQSLFRGETKMMGNSSLLMFPIYGMAFLIGPASKLLKHVPKFLRGCIYMLCIFGTEYSAGKFLKEHEMCPWDYSEIPWNVEGVIRLDFAPVWFLTGLVYEKILDDYA